jgi:hypothetical protein
VAGDFGLDSFGSGWEPVVDLCGHGGSPSGSVEDVQFLDPLGDLNFLERDSAPCSWLLDVILYGIPYRHWIHLCVCVCVCVYIYIYIYI